MKLSIPIGILYSSSGTYRRMSSSALRGARHAVDEINRGGEYDVTLRPDYFDPRGELDAYQKGVERFFDRGVHHVIGTTTSASRKDIVPDFEKTGGLLWYASPYEGFECSENVVYLGGCPNQNLVPLLDYALRQFGKQALLIGSNYVWGWESNRIARELVEAAGGHIIAEKYYRFGDDDFLSIVEQALARDAAFVLNNLVGESSYFFLRQLNAACARRGKRMPVLSCNFTESELPEIEALPHIQLLSCGPWFDTPGNAFAASQRVQHGRQSFSHCYTSAYNAVHLLAQACQATGGDDPERVLAWVHAHTLPTLMGELQISASNNHLSLPCCIAEAREGQFEVVHREPKVLEADPYLTRTCLSRFYSLADSPSVAPNLRVVK
ncbi:transporter substrate-binding protein [Halomonas sp. McH1-25]|uniref:transporter substrate-binding protein n=1 Tax=unclassified Halomonas TaxID=2609666 RepID=UPI001EF6428D|nr:MULTISPECIES: transporter substrate-binding protein [unclassified Halomonas]MCG7599941.1 transporter substrate-binding protein [Halomonas sp. McH1-25]MCP1342632.1 transporter substrate-binding protein [Halomonas sp. FL8]MCP1361347.1 transporter substrate-binding protein [Halomonas sp. BBD45]MCP1363843.1 transporter substrate-binding protein [Halomonas sp. BBD48]